MSLKDILVHISHGPHVEARLTTAIALAAAQDSHLIGVFPLSHPQIPGYIRMQIAEDVLQHQADIVTSEAMAAGRMFEERTERAGVKSEWRCTHGDTVPVLSLHTRVCDLAVVSQRDTTTEEAPEGATMPDELILGVGRPVLVVPCVGSFPTVGERVTVAWDGSRLAARAVHDAMPILERARRVMVVSINPVTKSENDVPEADICIHLARHGVNVEAREIFAEDIGAGEALLSAASEDGSDLLVMGAYGHARWREVVLGGATRHILRHMTLPVLMSH